VTETSAAEWTEEQWAEWHRSIPVLMREDRYEEIIASCDAVLAALSPRYPCEEAFSPLIVRSTALMALERIAEMIACTEQQVELARALRDSERFLTAYESLARAHGMGGDRDRQDAMLKTMFRWISGPGGVTRLLSTLTWCHLGEPPARRKLGLMFAEWALLVDPHLSTMWGMKYRLMLALGRRAEVEAAAESPDRTLAGLMSASVAAYVLERLESAAQLHRALAEAARAEGLEELAEREQETADRCERAAARKARERGEPGT